MEQWTIQKLLRWITEHFSAHAVDSPRLSAELLLADVLSMERIELYTNFDRVVEQEKLEQLRELVKRAAAGEPIAYLTGRCQFYSLTFEVTSDCMIPRPETELLVERAVEFLRGRAGPQLVCDLCTGCGCVAVAIASNHPDSRVIATDISDAALKVAAGNVAKYGLGERVTLLQGDLFEPLVPRLDAGGFDLVVCNPPYVSAAEYGGLDRTVKDYEPRTALYGGDDGLDVYRRIAAKVDDFLKPDAALMLEIGYAQGPAVRDLLEQTEVFGSIKVEKDFHDNDRIVIAVK